MQQEQPVPQTPSPVSVQQPQQPAKSNGLSVTALVLGILAVVTLLVPFVGLALGILAVIFGSVALRKRQSKGMAIAGICTGATAILLGLVGMLVVFGSYANVQQKAKDAAAQTEVQMMVSGIEKYVSSNGKLPDTASVVDGTFIQGAEQTVLPVRTSGEPTQGSILYRPQSSCHQTSASDELGFSVTTRLSDGTPYCVDGR